MPNNKLFIGFITYNDSTVKYLPFFLDSLRKQTCSDFKILALDNSDFSENENKKYISKNFPEIEYIKAEKNFGFGAGFNILINKSISQGAEYFLALNPDTMLESDFFGNILKSIEQDEKIGAVAPKILHWDFVNNQKTDLIDSTGIFVTCEHRFSDLNQGQADDGIRFQKAQEVFGFTGAAVLFRLKALLDVAYKDNKAPEFFDELMFMYKEDVDLSYRLRLAGWRIVYEPSAVIYHDRAASPLGDTNLDIAKNRKKKSPQIKKWSFLNHWILVAKFWHLPFSARVKSATAWYQFKSLGYALIFEPYLLKQLCRVWKTRNEIKKKKDTTLIRIDAKEIEKFMK